MGFSFTQRKKILNVLLHGIACARAAFPEAPSRPPPLIVWCWADAHVRTGGPRRKRDPCCSWSLAQVRAHGVYNSFVPTCLEIPSFCHGVCCVFHPTQSIRLGVGASRDAQGERETGRTNDDEGPSFCGTNQLLVLHTHTPAIPHPLSESRAAAQFAVWDLILVSDTADGVLDLT